jgi:ribosomal protein S7
MSTFSDLTDDLTAYIDHSEVVKMKGALYTAAFGLIVQKYGINPIEHLEAAIAHAIECNTLQSGTAGGVIQDAAAEVRLECRRCFE